MGGNVLGDASGFSAFFDNSLNTARSESAEISRGVGGWEIARIIEEKSRELVLAAIEIVGDFFGSSFGNKNWTVFLSFTSDNKFATVEIYRIAIEIDKFADAKSGAEQEFDNGAIAEISFGVFGDLVENFLDFVEMEESNLFF